MHLGHQAVILEAVRQAREAELPCVLVTFDRNPASVVAPEKCPKTVAGLQENLAVFKALGVSVTVVLPFDNDLSQMPAEEFLRVVLTRSIRATSVVVGHDFAMGKGRQGTAEWLATQMPTTIVPPFQIDGTRVSSSAIRSAVAEGRMEDAARWLGRYFAVSGVVVGGQKLGRQIGFPTINIARSFDQTVPAEGIYAGWATVPQGRYMAAVSIGVRPAVGGGNQTREAYMLDYPGDSVYGMAVELELVKKLRDEWNFPSLDDLVKQIQRDVEQTRLTLIS